MKSVDIDINAEGQVTIDAKGFRGNECDKATEQIELVLGGDGQKKKKPEYSMPNTGRQGTKLTF